MQEQENQKNYNLTEYINQLYTELKTLKKLDKETIFKLKIKLCKKLKIIKIPTDIEILMQADEEQLKFLKSILQTKPSRSLSGVIPIAIMTSPHPCPHGKCSMCPGGIDSAYGDVPQSYTGKEPATMRAIRANYDSYVQVFNRLEQYIVLGHSIEKADLIIMGGTFPARDINYQNEFITYAFKAMNDFSELFFEEKILNLNKFKEFFLLPGSIGNEQRTKKIHEKLFELKNKNKTTLEQEKLRNETSIVRCIGLTIETRPDQASLEQANIMLNQGCTRIELGIQSVYDEALKAINRGHDAECSIQAIRRLKDLGFKLNFHIMPGIPGVSVDEDINAFRILFSDSRYQPDMLKIYPLMVMPNTKLYDEFKQGKFQPLSTKQAAEIIAQAFKYIPKYCRIMRVQRDIPTYRIEAGVDKTNLRQYVDKELKLEKIIPQDIRARESGRKESNIENAKINIIEYLASEGKEFFISYEETQTNTLFGFCRLRFPSQQLRNEITPTTAIIRELHVYGESTSIGKDKPTSSQHKGIGKKLLKQAEEIAKQNNYNKIIVISGVGVREYYRKQGYQNDGVYVSKIL
ncbi:MAG: tRNA uridine(34) 5-carboxymethylaminomethyl modification radical SAM/GNAT enzyme Elp3 [Candidatus Woesearchaeota archaeon]